jgi:UDP-N-acetylglucosamine acyltransferase
VAGDSARVVGVNVVGMKRRGFKRESIGAVRAAARMLFDQDHGALPDRLSKLETQFRDSEPVQKIVAFVRGAGERPLCWPRRRQD